MTSAVPLRVLILYAGFGSGHAYAARAIEDALKLQDPSVTVESHDILKWGTWPSLLQWDIQRILANTPGIRTLYDLLWRHGVSAHPEANLGTLLPAFFRPFSEHITTLTPDIVVATHALPALLVHHARQQGMTTAKLICVATDFMVHGSWPTTDVETYVVATDASRETLSSHGIARDRIAVFGIPVRLGFQSLPDQASARRTWNVPLNMPAVLTAAGSADPHTGIYEKIRARLSALIDGARDIRDLSLFIITGNDAALKVQLEELTRTYDLPHVHILPYVEDIGSLMRAMDGLILKPGGLICAEALAAELPLFLVGPNVGQELENERYLTTIGAARMLPGTADDLRVVRTVLGNHRDTAAMREACRRARKPDAAVAIARHIHALLQENRAS